MPFSMSQIIYSVCLDASVFLHCLQPGLVHTFPHIFPKFGASWVERAPSSNDRRSKRQVKCQSTLESVTMVTKTPRVRRHVNETWGRRRAALPQLLNATDEGRGKRRERDRERQLRNKSLHSTMTSYCVRKDVRIEFIKKCKKTYAINHEDSWMGCRRCRDAR